MYRTPILALVLWAVLCAGPAAAQFPQGLSAADPSQQLKTTGMSLWGHSMQRPVVPSVPLGSLIEERETRPRLSRAKRAKAARARAARARARQHRR
mgnify:CR=1 FL=1